MSSFRVGNAMFLHYQSIPFFKNGLEYLYTFHFHFSKKHIWCIYLKFIITYWTKRGIVILYEYFYN